MRPCLCRSLPLRSAEYLILLLRVEAREFWDFAARVLAVNLYQAGNEEFLLLVCLSLPEVWLAKGDYEACVATPFSMAGRCVGAGEAFDMRKIIKVPSLANGVCPIWIFLGLVHADAAGLADSNYDNSRLFGIGGTGLRRRRRRRVRGEFGDSDVCDVGFEH